MLETLSDRWWVVALRGGAAGVFGLLALLTPGLTLGLLVSMFGLYALVDGGLALLAAGGAGRADGARLLLVEGAIGVAVGVLVVLWPGISVFVLLTLVAVRAIGIGAVELLQGHGLRRAGRGDWRLDAAGASSVLFGGAMLLLPSIGVLGTLWWLVLHAVVFGGLLGAFALRLRAMAREDSTDDGMVATV